jgi:hypothetical protein
VRVVAAGLRHQRYLHVLKAEVAALAAKQSKALAILRAIAAPWD